MSAVFAPSLNAFPSELSADSQVAKLRVPPHSIEAESSVLGGLLLDNGAWDRVGDLLADIDFYRHEHKLIYAAIGALINASKPADVITVNEQLQNQGKAEEMGGLGYLNSLAQYVPSASNIRRYAEIVRERSILRKLVSASDEIATNAFNPQGKAIDRILDEAEQKIFNIGEEGSRMKQGFQSMDTLVVELLDRVQEMADNPNDITGVPTGFYDLDRMTSGLQPGDMVVLAARPSMGKTAFAINIAEHVALNEGLPVAVFSMEMGASQLAVRVVVELDLYFALSAAGVVCGSREVGVVVVGQLVPEVGIALEELAEVLVQFRMVDQVLAQPGERRHLVEGAVEHQGRPLCGHVDVAGEILFIRLRKAALDFRRGIMRQLVDVPQRNQAAAEQ